jgi:hypothetical protein
VIQALRRCSAPLQTVTQRAASDPASFRQAEVTRLTNLNLRRVPRAGKRVDLRKRSYSQVWLLATSAGRARLRRAVRTHVLALV